jgi:L-lactate dehydrogenase complex protein LldF
MLSDPVLREALYCLRCGACLNVCPVYRRIGGHAYGAVYSGPIGSIVSPNLFGSAAAQLPFASTLCGACREVCPVRIDIPRMLLHLRWKEGQGNGAPQARFSRSVTRSRRGMRRFAKLAVRPRSMRFMLRVGAAAIWPFARDGYLRRIPGSFSAWTRGRDFPALGGKKRPSIS